MIYLYPPTFFRVHGNDFCPFTCENCSAESKDRATNDDLFIGDRELRVGQGTVQGSILRCIRMSREMKCDDVGEKLSSADWFYWPQRPKCLYLLRRVYIF